LKFLTCVVGLGNIGFLFDFDKKRQGVWSHVSAYNKSKWTKLVAVVEPDLEKRKLFSKHYPSVPTFSSVKELLCSGISVDICSICTPSFLRKEIIEDVLKIPSLKSIFCEKPFATSSREGRNLLNICQKKKISLAVNHTRRWEEIYLKARSLISEGAIGQVVSVNAIYSGQIYNIGSHLIDTVRMLVTSNPKSVYGQSCDIKKLDPDITGIIEFENGVFCSVSSTKKREDLLFEIDVVGTEGRLKISQNGGKIEFFRFTESKRYSGYRELKPCSLSLKKGRDRFVAAVDNLCENLVDKKIELMCTGFDAYISLLICEMLQKSSSCGKKINVKFKK
jgi:predicted dehydrogenase